MRSRCLVTERISVRVLWSPSARQLVEVPLQIPVGSTVLDALRASKVLAGLQDAEVDALLTGVWNHKRALSHGLRDGDRVELYRPLKVDPKIARRERFTRQGARGTGLFSKRRAGAKSGY